MGQRLPSLDGLRAVSIGFVVLGHVLDGTLTSRPLFFLANGDLGVNIFFGISGFLITDLLVKEFDCRGKVDLVHFYLRRAFRIFPAFYCYLGTLLLLGAMGLIKIVPKTWLSAACYLRNYYPPFEGSGDYFTAHAWSLAVEEQFYLLWPPCFALLGRRGAIWLASALIALSPGARVLNYFLLPQLRTDVNYLLHTRIDALMVGCLAALLVGNPQFDKLLHRAFVWRLPLLAIPFVLFASPWLHVRYGGTYQLLFGYTLEALAIVLALLWVVNRPGTVLGRLLNLRIMAHIGVISYSLYLWQQLFTYPHAWWSLPATLIAAETSYRLIERPFLRWRDCVVRSRSRLVSAGDAATLVHPGLDDRPEAPAVLPRPQGR